MSDDFAPKDIQAEIEAAYLSGMTEAAIQLDVSASDLLGDTNATAAAYAKTRAAQAVTMIDDTTQDKIRQIVTDAFSDPNSTIESITEQIDGAGIFSESRAAMIARTEVARAQMQGTLAVWKTLGVELVDVLLSNDDPCPECQEISDSGPYDLDDPILDEYPFHPNCQCTLVVITSNQ